MENIESSSYARIMSAVIKKKNKQPCSLYAAKIAYSVSNNASGQMESVAEVFYTWIWREHDDNDQPT